MKEKAYSDHLIRFHQEEDLYPITTKKLLHAHLVNKILLLQNNKKKYVVLDAGCGLGMFLETLKKHNISAKGFDSNKFLLEYCKKKGLKVSKQDLTSQLQYKSESFDFIHCSHVLEHIADPENALAEFFRVLKPEGRLFIAVPPFNHMFYDEWDHVRPFTPRTLLKLAQHEGFVNYRVRKRHFAIGVRRYNNPLVRVINFIIFLPIINSISTYCIEHIFNIHRHDLVLEARKPLSRE